MAKLAPAAFLFLAGCSRLWSQSSSPQPAVAEVANAFPTYRQITKSVVYVNPELAMLCRGASQEEVEAARLKYGPHAHTGILIYMNEPAAKAFGGTGSAFPVGAVIVKQKTLLGYRNAEGKEIRQAAKGVGGMIKRPAGYDPAHGDWEYFYFEDPKKIESGRIESCVQCHSAAKDKGYVFGNWRQAGR